MIELDEGDAGVGTWWEVGARETSRKSNLENRKSQHVTVQLPPASCGPTVRTDKEWRFV